MLHEPVELAELPAIPQHFAQPGFSLRQIFSMLAAYRLQSVVIIAVIVVGSAVAIKQMPKTYQSSATLLFDYQVNDPLGGKEFPLALLASYMSTQMELMRSPDVLLPVIDRLKLRENDAYTDGYQGDGGNLNDFLQEQLLKSLTIEQGQGSQLIYVTSASRNPVEATNVANAVADAFLEANRNRMVGPASDRAKRYTELLAELKGKVITAQDQLTAFRQSAGIADMSAANNQDAETEILRNLENKLVETQNQRRAAEARVARIANGEPLGSEMLSSNITQNLNAQLVERQAKMAQLRTTLGSNHPQVLELQSQLNAARQSLAAVASSEVQAAVDLETKQRRAADEQRAKLLAVRKLQDEASKYIVEFESAQAVYKRTLDNYDQMFLTSGGEYTNVQLVNRATIPIRASKPNKSKLLMMAVMLGGFIGLAGPFLYELFNRRIRCRDDLERHLRVPVLAELGRIAPLAPGGVA
jgi:uncharacterized protein involved in exopolysaccharide biosynthesis